MNSKAISIKSLKKIDFFKKHCSKWCNQFGNELDKDTGLTDFNNAISLDPNNYNYYYNRSIKNLEIGNKSGAFEDAKIAFKLDSNLETCLLYIKCLLFYNQFYEALNWTTKALALYPSEISQITYWREIIQKKYILLIFVYYFYY